MLDEGVIRCRDGKTFETRYLRKGFSEMISVIRILDSRRENFKLSKAYESKEYNAIIQMYQENKVSIPIKAFFGDLLNRPRRLKDYPITLINSNINLDQLLAINNGMKYPLAYIQGPPGTGKTVIESIKEI